MIPSGSIVFTREDLIFYTVYEGGGILRGMIGYVPETCDLEGHKLKQFNGRSYRKIFNASYEHQQKILRRFSGIKIDNGWNSLVGIPDAEIAKIRTPFEIRDNLRETLPLDDLLNIFEIEPYHFGVSGSCGIDFVPSQVHDIDIFFYGRDIADRIWKQVEKLSQANPLYIDGKYYRTRFRYEDYWYCVHFVPLEDENELIGMDIKLQTEEPIRDIVLEDTSNLFFPGFIDLESGRKLLTFRPGHTGLFRKGFRLFIPDAEIAKIITSNNKVYESVLLTKYQWVEIDGK